MGCAASSSFCPCEEGAAPAVVAAPAAGEEAVPAGVEEAAPAAENLNVETAEERVSAITELIDKLWTDPHENRILQILHSTPNDQVDHVLAGIVLLKLLDAFDVSTPHPQSPQLIQPLDRDEVVGWGGDDSAERLEAQLSNWVRNPEVSDANRQKILSCYKGTRDLLANSCHLPEQLTREQWSLSKLQLFSVGPIVGCASHQPSKSSPGLLRLWGRGKHCYCDKGEISDADGYFGTITWSYVGETAKQKAQRTKKEFLCVRVQSCAELKDLGTLSKSDPFVKVILKYRDGGEEWRRREFKTTVNRDNLDPEYGECFEFEIDPSWRDQATLTFEVWDANPLSDEMMGQRKYRLSDLNLTPESTSHASATRTVALEGVQGINSTDGSFGTLTYSANVETQLERFEQSSDLQKKFLHVKVESCAWLKDLETVSTSDPYVKVILKDTNHEGILRMQTKQTEVKNNNLNPEYNEQFEFEVCQGDAKATLKFEVWDDNIMAHGLMGQREYQLDRLTEDLLSPSSKACKGAEIQFVPDGTKRAMADEELSITQLNLHCTALVAIEGGPFLTTPMPASQDYTGVFDIDLPAGESWSSSTTITYKAGFVTHPPGEDLTKCLREQFATLPKYTATLLPGDQEDEQLENSFSFCFGSCKYLNRLFQTEGCSACPPHICSALSLLIACWFRAGLSERADRSFKQMDELPVRPRLLLLLGDQIYADCSTVLINPADSLAEFRYAYR